MQALRFLSRMILIAMPFLMVSPAAWATPEEDTVRADEFLRNGDLPSAMRLLQGAADKGYAPAQARLGEILDHAEEDKQAVVWYRKAAEQGNAAGMYGLGVAYLTGQGVEKDFKLAHEWILRAAEKDFVMAMDALAGAYRTGSMGLVVNMDNANYWAAKADALRPPPEPSKQPVGKEKRKKGAR